jgi:phosphatidylglycerophosphate synthase
MADPTRRRRPALDPPEGDVPRVKDLPKPRRATSILGPTFGKVFAWPYRVALSGLYRVGFLPWQLSVLSLAANGVIGWLFLTGRRFVPGLVLIVAGLLDIFDGGVARLRGEAGPAGAFLDSVLDRVSDVILFGCLYWSLADQGHVLSAGFALGALVVSLMVSHIRAEGEAMGLTLSEGLMQRLERYVLLMIGLTVPKGWGLLPVLVVMVMLGGITVLQRAVFAWGRLDPDTPTRTALGRMVRRAARKSDKSNQRA